MMRLWLRNTEFYIFSFAMKRFGGQLEYDLTLPEKFEAFELFRYVKSSAEEPNPTGAELLLMLKPEPRARE
jgi:hypothetical protein